MKTTRDDRERMRRFLSTPDRAWVLPVIDDADACESLAAELERARERIKELELVPEKLQECVERWLASLAKSAWNAGHIRESDALSEAIDEVRLHWPSIAALARKPGGAT